MKKKRYQIEKEPRVIFYQTKDGITNREEITLYWGETKNNKPHGKGISETYEITDTNSKIIKTLSPLWWKKYSRDLKGKDLVGNIIIEKYEGEWANGKKKGKGELITYYDPADSLYIDCWPQIFDKSIGIFKNDILFNGKSKGGGLFKIIKNGKEKIIRE
jgi:hypothetical protein